MKRNVGVDISEDVLGQQLLGVSEYLESHGESGPRDKEAVRLHFESCVVCVEASTDTSEIVVYSQSASGARSTGVSPTAELQEASDSAPYCDCVGRHARNWWMGKNESGYTDLFMIAFAPTVALCFVAMNNVVSVALTSGEQIS